MEIQTRTKVYDVCIVGSGAGGGMAAKVLTEAGADTVLLEAGPNWDVTKDGAMLKWNYESPRRGAGYRGRPFGEFDASLGGWDLEGEPYTTAPGTRFLWWRSRMVGGRTNHWGRISLRFGPWDFKGRSRDGVGDDWPISYDDMKPYYDKLDASVGLFGSNEGLPNDPDGIFMPPPAPRAYERLIKKSCDALEVTCIPSRLSILTKPLNGRAACHYCGQCGRGCSTHSNFSTPSVLLPPAFKTGKLTLVTGAMAREVITSDEGLATGVSYVDTKTGRETQVRAKVVVLAASACESARLESLPPYTEDGTGGMHVYMPWWGDNKKLDFPRGYHIEPWGGRGMPGAWFMGGIQQLNGGGYGKGLKADYRRFYGSTVGFSGRGEMVPNKDCYCDVDPEVVDRWGIPVLRFHWKWSDYEIRQAKHMQDTFTEIIEHMGGKVLGKKHGPEDNYDLSEGGEIIHEAGTTRMGDSAATSVLDKNCQAHDCRNLFVADSGPFVSNAHKNMTWTILALSMRTSEHIAEELKKGSL
jgi:choline dehydrogenase-like flavoprotein